MSILSWLLGNESEAYEDGDNRLVVRDTTSDTTWTYGGNYDQTHEQFLEENDLEVVEDNRGIWRKLFG